MGLPKEVSPEERAELIRQGYRPIEVWVPDTTSKAYREEAERQAKSAVEADRRAGIEELSDETQDSGWDRP